ncbi:CU044_5270 family protein [Streptomyces sp. NPDC093598]|uniref:CU044_5270 family protein n=1 Tax=Streptomyces sp. NPDC093598 TaxID=3366046 RepID=UPI00381D6FC0
MNANTSRHNSAAWDESARLLSGTARDLPTGRHHIHKERLMAQIHAKQLDERTASAAPAKTRRLRLPRPAIALPAMTVALAGMVTAAIVTNNGSGGRGSGVATGPALTTEIGAASTKGVPQLLDRISLAAAQGSRPAVKPGQYIYIESKIADTFLKTVDDKTTLASHELHRRQVWNSPDGKKGWLIDPMVNENPKGEPLSLPDEQGNTPQAYLNNPSYNYLTELPTDPDELLARIYKETKSHGSSPDQEAFTTIGDLLRESYPPAELYPALFKAAAKIPGVVVVDEAEDAVGRHGVAVARLDETSGAREEWIFDKKTHVFLGERSVQVKQLNGSEAPVKPGTVNFTSAVLKRAVVDDIKQTPAQGG